MTELFIGVDFGGTNVKLGLVDHVGKVLARDEAPSKIEQGPDDLIGRIGDQVEHMLSEKQIKLDQIRAAGIGSPGPIDLEAGKIVTACNLPASFDDYPVRDRLSKRLSCPVAFDNDANVACWGEFWLGAGSDIDDMILFTLGTGIGGGVISSGELVHGCTGNAAELGHILVWPGGRLCTCGQKGCLESYASATHIAARANEAMDAGIESKMNLFRKDHGPVSCKDVFDFAKQGDALADEIVNDAAKALGIASVTLRHVVEQERVILAGGVIQAGDMISQRVQQFYDEFMWTQHPEPMEVRLATLGTDAGIIGAAGIAVHVCEKGLM